MITPMKKLQVIVHNKKLEAFVGALQDLGVVHIETKKADYENLKNLKNKRDKINKLLKALTKVTEIKSTRTMSVDDILASYDASLQRLDELKNKLLKFQRDNKALLPWGYFKPDVLQALKVEAGINLIFYRAPRKAFMRYDFSKTHVEVIKNDGVNIYFVVVYRDKLEEDLPFEKLELPDLSLEKSEASIDECQNELKTIENKIEQMAAYRDVLHKEALRLEDIISGEKTLASFTNHFDKISSLYGWVPETREKDLNSFLLQEEGIVYELLTPEDSDDVPVKLKNSKFAKLFEPITKLFDLPAYTELDLTPFFAPFFAFFFGLCLGDAGYGVVLLLATTFAFFKFKQARSLAILGIILSFFTIFCGLITGTTFGMNLFEIKLPILSDLAVLQSTHVFYFALVIGLIQILFGMILQAINRSLRDGLMGGLSTIGWILLVLFLVIMYLGKKEAVEGFTLGEYIIIACRAVPEVVSQIGMGLGLFLILFFNDLKANIFVRFGKGLWELYGITGFAGDLLSYIRLFALGVSSAILGNVVNSIALQLLNIKIPVLSQFLFVMFIVVGHGGNMLLAALGSFVHPLRLTFVEFYKNAGFTGGGKVYQPLCRMLKEMDIKQK